MDGFSVITKNLVCLCFLNYKQLIDFIEKQIFKIEISNLPDVQDVHWQNYQICQITCVKTTKAGILESDKITRYFRLIMTELPYPLG